MWKISYDEIHLQNSENDFCGQLFGSDEVISGKDLYEKAQNNTYYIVFVTLRAFDSGNLEKSIADYKDFLHSDCQIILSIYDCSHVLFCAKDHDLLEKMCMHIQRKGFKFIEFITDKDLIDNTFISKNKYSRLTRY